HGRATGSGGPDLLGERLRASVRGQRGTDSLYDRACVVEAALLEAVLSATHELVCNLVEPLHGRRVAGLRLDDAAVQRPRAVLLGLDEHACLEREIGHPQRIVQWSRR